MTQIQAPAEAATRTNSSKFLVDAVVVATDVGLAIFPERVRKRLANRWGVVRGSSLGASEVIVFYPAIGVKVEMLVPFPLGAGVLTLVTDDQATAAWRAALREREMTSKSRPRRRPRN